MAQARAHLPNNLQNNVVGLKALSKKILKHYVVKRLDHWLSVKGQASDYAKYGVYLASFGTYGSKKTSRTIIDDCSRVKAELEKASKYSDYQNLIKTLVELSVEAKNAKLPGISSDPLRVDTYFAIIALIREIMQIEFPGEYQADITKHRKGYEAAVADYKEKYESGLELDQVINEKYEHLKQLVLLGDRTMYSTAFESHNPFPELFTRLSGKASFVEANHIADFTGIIKLQLLNEQGWTEEAVKEHMQGLSQPNPNHPEQLQHDFAILYCKKQMNKSLGYAAMLAIKDDKDEFGKDFYTIYLADPEKFVAENKPDPMIERVKTNPEAKPADEQMKYLPKDNSAPLNQEAAPPNSNDQNTASQQQSETDSTSTPHNSPEPLKSELSDVENGKEESEEINSAKPMSPQNIPPAAPSPIQKQQTALKEELADPVKKLGDVINQEFTARTAAVASEESELDDEATSPERTASENVVSLSRSSSTIFTTLNSSDEATPAMEQRQQQESPKQSSQDKRPNKGPATQRRRNKK